MAGVTHRATQLRDQAVRAAVPAPAPTTAAPAAPPVNAEPATRPAERTEQVTPLPQLVLAWADAHRGKLFLLAAAVFLLGFNAQWRPDPDSALYLTIGRNVAQGQGYTYHGQPHRLVYPGLPWLFAGLFKVFGTGSLLPAIVTLQLFALATLALVYRLFLLHAGRATAVLMVVALALSRTFYRYSFELLTDLPFLMGVAAFLVGVESLLRRRQMKAGAGEVNRTDRDDDDNPDPSPRGRPHAFDWLLLVGGFGVAVVTRPTMWALLLAVVAAVLWLAFRPPLRWRRAGVGLAILTAAVVAGVAFYALDPRRAGAPGTAGAYEEAMLNALRRDGAVRRVFTANLPKLFQPSAAEALFGLDLGGLDLGSRLRLPVAALPSLAVVAAALLLFRRRVLWGMFAAATILMMVAVEVHVRYFLQILPLLLFAWWLGMIWVYRRLPTRWAGPAFVALGVAVVAINLIRVAGFVVEQRRVPFIEHLRGGRYAAIERVAAVLRQHVEPDAWVLAPRPFGRILTYVSGRRVTEPGEATTLDAKDPNLRIYVLEPMDDEGRHWMRHMYYPAATGEPVAAAPSVAGKKGRTAWRLHKAVPVERDDAAASAARAAAPASTPRITRSRSLTHHSPPQRR